MTGQTRSSDFPTSTGAFDDTYGGGHADAFVTKLDTSGSALDYSTYLGGSSNDYGYAIAIDSAGHAFVTGGTQSSDFPASTGAFDNTLGGARDGFVTKLDASGANLDFSTYLGGTNLDSGEGIAVDSSGYAFVAGYTSSADFPTSAGVFGTTIGGGGDGFVTRFDTAGMNLGWSSYLGGSYADYVTAVAIDSSSNAYVTGYTYSPDFPTSTGAFDTTYGGGYDIFVTRVAAGWANGTACTNGAACASGICEDGLCCAVSCGLCLSCESTGTSCSVVPADDPDCGIIDCSGLDTDCRTYQDLSSARCEGSGDCKDANSPDCTLYDDSLPGTDCGSPSDTDCDDPDTCDGSGTCADNNEADGTPCPGGICDTGVCELVGGAGGAATGGAGGAALGGAGGVGGMSTGGTGASSPGPVDPEQSGEIGGGGCDCRLDAGSPAPDSGRLWLLVALAALASTRRQRIFPPQRSFRDRH